MHLKSGLGPGLGFSAAPGHVAQLVVGLCNTGCIRGMRGKGGGEGGKGGKAVVGWVKVGEAGVHKARAGALFCGVPWVFLFKLLF